ncbi:hypothetical protein WA588_001734, partial [Blastocystis sp. NMH]
MDISLDSPDEGQEKTHITIADILEDSCTFSPQSTPGCVFQDGIIKVITDIRSDMRSSPLQDEQKLFLRQEMVCRGALYLKALAKQLVSESGLFPINSDEWVSVVLKLSRAVCDNLTEETDDDVRLPFSRPGMEIGGSESLSSPNADAAKANKESEGNGKSNESIDSIVRIIEIEEGLPEQSEFVDGLMIKKNLAHKGMRHRIESPRILLISCPIEYYKNKYQYASLSTLLSQEVEHIQIIVKKIMTLSPDVILVGSNVSKHAIDLFVEQGVSIVVNCEASILAQAAKMTGAKIIKHLDDIAFQNPQELIGTCGLFIVRNYRTAMHRQFKSSYVDVHARNHHTHYVTYCCFECCDVSRGCTVLLRGGNSATLAKCHEILMYLIKVRMNQEREISFYINLGITSTPYSIMKEPNLYVKTQRLLASSPCIVFGNPHFASTNTHSDFFAISKLSPIQSFNIIYACVRLYNGSQCALPEIKRIDFYSQNDRSFEQFLKESCFNTRSLCSNPKCLKPLNAHTLRLLHNGLCLSVTSANVGSVKQMSSVIRVWSRCSCGQETSPEVMSKASLRLSMGVVLQLLFYEDVSTGPCGHKLFRNRTLFFLQGNILTTFTLETMNTYGITSYPALWTEDSQLPKLLDSQMQSFLSLQNRVFSTIIEVISVNIQEAEDSEKLISLKTLLSHISEGARVLNNDAKSIRLTEYNSLYTIYRLRQFLYLWSKRWVKSLCDILNKDVMRDASSPLSFHPLTSLTLETIPQTSESPIVQDATDHPDQHSTPDGIIKPSDIISLPEELFFGNPQLPPDPDNRFIPVTTQQPTTLFAYTLSTEAYLRECEAMRKLVLEGGTEGTCDNEKVLLDRNDNEVKLTLDLVENGQSLKMTVLVYFATQFEVIRAERNAASYLLSLSICSSRDMHGGKSGAEFFVTGDNKYLVKVISAREFEMFVTNAHTYFKYTSNCLFHRLPSLLCKVLGIYQTVSVDPTNKRTVTHYVVMENLFYNQIISYKFDLKGSNRNRYATEGTEESTLLDMNFMEKRKGVPLPLHESAKTLLNIGIMNDTLFLSIINVVDYSLLVGVNEETKELVVGIIDYFRCYDIIKKIENGVKSVGMIIGEKEPTVIPPDLYKKRFRTSMDSYFITMPDRYFQLKNLESK